MEEVEGATLAHYWVHNGFVRVGDEKMSMSLGNFMTIRWVGGTWEGHGNHVGIYTWDTQGGHVGTLRPVLGAQEGR